MKAGDSWCPWHLFLSDAPRSPKYILHSSPSRYSVSGSKLHIKVAQKAVSLFMSSSLHFQIERFLQRKGQNSFYLEKSNYSISYAWKTFHVKTVFKTRVNNITKLLKWEKDFFYNGCGRYDSTWNWLHKNKKLLHPFEHSKAWKT